MKVIKSFVVGSVVFFSGMEGFIPHDKDELCLVDKMPFDGNVIKGFIHGKDVFFFRNMDKEGFINDSIQCDTPMRAGKFLVPEFAEYIDMTIEDLKSLQSVFDRLDDKHLYEKVIYDAYLENNGFFLTESQRAKAYEMYKLKRL